MYHVDSKSDAAAPTRDQVLTAVAAAYRLGGEAVKKVNYGRGWSETASKKERAALDKLLKQFGCGKLSDEEYHGKFN